MNPEEFKEIFEFLDKGSYPEATKISPKQLWNFKRKIENYTLSETEPKRLCKLSFDLLITLLVRT